jgi:hypothetical protein
VFCGAFKNPVLPKLQLSLEEKGEAFGLINKFFVIPVSRSGRNEEPDFTTGIVSEVVVALLYPIFKDRAVRRIDPNMPL